jgi:hypothetical protein
MTFCSRAALIQAKARRIAANIAKLPMPDSRFPPPWSVEEHNDACFIVRDHNGQALAYVYFEDEAGAEIG